MTRDVSFWRNVTIIGLFHIAFVVGIVLWSASARRPLGSGIVWMEHGVEQTAPLTSPQLQVKEPDADEETESDQPEDAVNADSHVASTPVAKPMAKKPKASATPKSTRTAAKKTSKPSAKTVTKQEEHSKKASGVAGSSNHTSSAGNASQFSSYGNMLHDRFFSSWEQPTSVVATGAKISVLVRLRIEKDGRVSNFALVRPSGNVVVDDSVAAVAKRVTKVDPLPEGLGSGGHYDVNINFELNAD